MKVFVSYSSTDRDLVGSIVADLEAAGYDVWFDKELSGGQAWWDVILEQVRTADALVFAVTEASLESQACRSEAAYAVSVGRTVIPVRMTDIGPDDAPSTLQQVQWIDYREPSRSSGFAIVRAINNATPRELPDPLPEPPPVPLSYLGDLVDKVDATGTLTLENQLSVVFTFRQLVENGREPAKVEGLLRRFRRRDDLLAKVAVDIDALLAQISATQAATPEPTTTPATSRKASPPVPPIAPAPDGSPASGGGSRRRALIAAAAVVVVGTGIGIALAAGGGDGEQSEGTTTTAAESPQTTATPTTTLASTFDYVCAGGAALCVRIDSLDTAGDAWLIEWTAVNFTPDTSHHHAHFFWDDQEVGSAGGNAADFGLPVGKWELTMDQPFQSTAAFLKPSARPAGATKICVTVGDLSHNVVDPANHACAPIP